MCLFCFKKYHLSHFFIPVQGVLSVTHHGIPSSYVDCTLYVTCSCKFSFFFFSSMAVFIFQKWQLGPSSVRRNDEYSKPASFSCYLPHTQLLNSDSSTLYLKALKDCEKRLLCCTSLHYMTLDGSYETFSIGNSRLWYLFQPPLLSRQTNNGMCQIPASTNQKRRAYVIVFARLCHF